ncbi:MAG: cell division protein FtsA [Armatimonadetes bacterium]|nr:cell division protein FtsA [Armatimonadota bacterium]MDW8026913.1 cell division protein FtsA [Armatimonadota bacterium]
MYRPTAPTVVGLDVGTTKVCTLVARLLPEGWDVVSFATVPSKGVQRATIVDINEAASAIANSIERAEQSSGMEIRSAWVGITGHHIRAFPVEVSMKIPDEEGQILREHVESLIEIAKKSQPIPDDHSILHTIPRQFAINGVGGIKRPLGLSAREVKMQALVVTASSSFMKSLVSCVSQAGIEIEGMVLEPLAAGMAALSESERELGTALLDIGGGTTDVAVFLENSLVDTFALPVGGNHVTRDLAIGLRTPIEEAERLKINYGCALPEKVSSDETVEVIELGRGKPRPIPKRALAEIIEPRMRELFELASERLARKGWMSLLAGGVVLTGGGSLLDGSLELAQSVFGLPVRIGEPSLTFGAPQELKSPIYATVVGLVLYGIKQRRTTTEITQPWWRKWENFWQRLRRWLPW